MQAVFGLKMLWGAPESPFVCHSFPIVWNRGRVKSMKRLKLLVVDDEPDIRLELQDFVEELGFECLLALMDKKHWRYLKAVLISTLCCQI